MEIVAILLAAPAAFVAAVAYRAIVVKVFTDRPRFARVLRSASYVMLLALLAEWIALALRGSVAARLMFGVAYYPVHLFLLFLAPPALINVLVLRDPAQPLKWYSVAGASAALALALAIEQYSVSEALYGIDGVGGPFSFF